LRQDVPAAEAADQRAFDRQHQKLAERSSGCRDAHGPGAARCVDVAADHAVDHRIGGGGLRQAEHHAGRQREGQRGGGQRHRGQAGRVHATARDEDAKGAEAVGHHTHEQAGHAPAQVLHRQGEGERFTRPAALHRDGLQPQAEAVAHAHRQRDDRSTASEHLQGRQPRATVGGRGGGRRNHGPL